MIVPVSNYFLDAPHLAPEIINQAARHPATLMWAVSNEAAFAFGEPGRTKAAALSRVVRQVESGSLLAKARREWAVRSN